MRLSLASDSDRWFFWLVLSSIIVGIGVALEAPEATIALKRWYRLWRGKDVEPTNEKSLVIPTAYLGLLLVVAGVMGEGIFEFLSAQAETALRGHDEKILGETESKFGQVKESAEAAANAAGQAESSATKANASAKEASSKSGEAVTSAGNAINLANRATQEADSFEKDIVSAKTQAASAESHLADALQRAANAEAELNRLKTPRSLIRINELVAALKPFAGTEYELDAFLDNESGQFAKSVASVLDSAGWIMKQPGLRLNVPTVETVLNNGAPVSIPACIDTGMSLKAHTTLPMTVLHSTPIGLLPKTLQAAIALQVAMRKGIVPTDPQNISAGNVDPKPADDVPLTVCVGKKP